MQGGCVRCVGVAELYYVQFFSLKIQRISFEDLRYCQLRRNLASEARLPEGTYKVRLDLVLHGRNGGSGGKRSWVWEPVQQKLETEKMVTVGMGDVNGCEIFAALGDPIQQLFRMLHRQEGIDEDGIAFARDEDDRVGNPSEIFLAGRKGLE
jgi:hypothetical protein